MRFDPNGTIKLWKVLLAPLDRIGDVSPPAWVLAAVVGAWNYVRDDTFTGALGIMLLCAAGDYVVGRKAARLAGRYNPAIAHAGAMGKITGVLLVLLVRLVEGWLYAHAIVDTRGGIATALTVALFVVDLQSIAHHRESFGATPIPVLSQLLAWLQELFASRIPGRAAVPARRRRARRANDDLHADDVAEDER